MAGCQIPICEACLRTKQIHIQLIDSKGNLADALSKALSKVDFDRLRKLLVSKQEMDAN